MMDEEFKMKGHVRIESREKGGDWKTIIDKDNLIVNSGKEFVMDRVFKTNSEYIGWFGVGSSLTTSNSTDTDLGYPLNITSTAAPHKVFTSIADSGTKFTIRLDLSTVEPSTQPVSISEVGLFGAISGGSLFSRVVHVPITKNNTTELRYYYDINVES